MPTETSSEQSTFHIDERPRRHITLLRGDADLGRVLADKTGVPDVLSVGGAAQASGLLVLCLQPTAWWLIELDPERDYAAAWRDIQDVIASGYQVDISAAHTVFRLQGADAVQQLARMSCIDFRLKAFPAGHCLRASLASVAAVVYRIDSDTFDLYCPRTYADYMRYVFDSARSALPSEL